jgi:hypothetical protein
VALVVVMVVVKMMQVVLAAPVQTGRGQQHGRMIHAMQRGRQDAPGTATVQGILKMTVASPKSPG